ncbi:hypothetical protein TELCIR_03609 [Teladorsagia circumcincta]|uniref:Uncharacterized protein n=1 Tax=Teladorsagia circumcincta TaxID=45464 RepID=A0A2G9UW58_TELCI|nr:hypothetical protein TELCIR_03609 [Teladorsagia circumcincta]
MKTHGIPPPPPPPIGIHGIIHIPPPIPPPIPPGIQQQHCPPPPPPPNKPPKQANDGATSVDNASKIICEWVLCENKKEQALFFKNEYAVFWGYCRNINKELRLTIAVVEAVSVEADEANMNPGDL